MLKGIDPRMPAELLYVLARMGHGDEIAVVDRNYPARTTAAGTITGEVIDMTGFNATQVIELITALMPIDAFVPHGALFMQKDGQGEVPEPVHAEVTEVLMRDMPEGGGVGSIPRLDFYDRAPDGFAVVRCSEDRPYGCFILRKGVIFDA